MPRRAGEAVLILAWVRGSGAWAGERHRALLPSFCCLHQPPPSGLGVDENEASQGLSFSFHPAWFSHTSLACCENPRPNTREAVRNSRGLTPVCGSPGRPPPSRLPPSSLVRMKRGWDEAYQSLALTLSVLLVAWGNLLD